MDRTDSGWRARWAARENKRRRRTYEDHVEAWCLRGARLQRLRAAAEELPVESAAGLPVGLADGEVVVAVQPKAELVEVDDGHDADLPVPELAVIPVRWPKRANRLPKGLRVTDAGTAVVTDRRLILLGREKHREWTYAQVSDLAHHTRAPITLLHTIGGRPVAGLRVPLAAAARFRLRLTMAHADFIGQRRVVLARLDEAVAANRRSRPPAPVVATAEHAPAAARLAYPAVVAAAVALIALPTYAMTVASPDRPQGAFHNGGAPITPGALPGTETAPSAAPTPDPPAPSAAPAPDPPAPSAAPATDPRTPGTTATRAADPDVSTGAPAPGPVDLGAPRPLPTRGLIDPAPAPTGSPGKPMPADRCGAPENPYGYNYCGGSLVRDPAPGVCSWFVCVDGFWQGRGYLTVCEDGRVGMVGGTTGTCPERAGRKEPVYAYQPAGG
ncbi:hypothetical protein [Micromonospora kangleipakensis]|uniref:hypothetical protein n=1 Tax=Micromonospora kangleipakensis TaxID=1077942 RepID=UPI00102A9470|nr:hypothetical protein [Micromonospora kangleipakensis]